MYKKCYIHVHVPVYKMGSLAMYIVHVHYMFINYCKPTFSLSFIIWISNDSATFQLFNTMYMYKKINIRLIGV